MTSTPLDKKCDRSEVNFLQLPNKFKVVGFALTIISFLILFYIRVTSDIESASMLPKYGMLLGLLIVSISKEKIEDEMIKNIRLKSFSFAFVVGVLMAIALPFVDYALDSYNKPEALFKDLGDFEILWILLGLQVVYFHYLGRIFK